MKCMKKWFSRWFLGAHEARVEKNRGARDKKNNLRDEKPKVHEETPGQFPFHFLIGKLCHATLRFCHAAPRFCHAPLVFLHACVMRHVMRAPRVLSRTSG